MSSENDDPTKAATKGAIVVRVKLLFPFPLPLSLLFLTMLHVHTSRINPHDAKSLILSFPLCTLFKFRHRLCPNTE